MFICSSLASFLLLLVLLFRISVGSTTGVLISTNALQISEIKVADIPDVDLSRVGVTKYGNFSVEIVDPVSDYLDLMEVNNR